MAEEKMWNLQWCHDNWTFWCKL